MNLEVGSVIIHFAFLLLILMNVPNLFYFSAKKNKVIDNIKKSTTSSNNETKDNRTSSPVQSQKHQSESPKSKTPELHFNYKKPRQYPLKDTKHSHKDESVGRRSRERQRRQSEGVEKKEG